MGGGSAGYGAYYQEPSATGFSTATGMQQNTMGYHQSATGYGQDARQPQSFAGSYNPNLMYNVPQTGAQNTVYDTTGASSFDLRQPAAQQIMPADVTNTYFPSEPTNAAAASAMQTQQPSTAQTAAVYQQGSTDSRNNMMNYPSNIAGMGNMATQATAAAADVSMEETGDYQGSSDLNQAYQQYQDALKGVFSNIKDGALETAGKALLSVSDWLLGHVHELGTCAPWLAGGPANKDVEKPTPLSLLGARSYEMKLLTAHSGAQASRQTTSICTATGSSYGTTSTMHG